jgi:nitroimidazol reductase NimA-like FMN-containing flavoprotein (pyridoxamine 5'-phosphate oxidase superfamily)
MTTPSPDGSQLEQLDDAECVRLLRATTVGRIAFAVNSEAWIFPVNYQLVGDAENWRILLSTRPGNRIDRAARRVAFEIDGVDEVHHAGWSVLIRGSLHHLGQGEAEPRPEGVDPATWVDRANTSWLAIDPDEVTGRRLNARAAEWPVPDAAYL